MAEPAWEPPEPADAEFRERVLRLIAEADRDARDALRIRGPYRVRRREPGALPRLRDATLRDLHARYYVALGWSSTQVAELVWENRYQSVRSCAGALMIRWHRLGLRTRSRREAHLPLPLPDGDVRHAYELHVAGCGLARLATELGTSAQRLRREFGRLGLPPVERGHEEACLAARRYAAVRAVSDCG